jgi:SAM-dependent methyltransferase
MTIQTDPETQDFIQHRNALLKDIDPKTIRSAWFALSHLLLDDGAKVVDMGCDDGAMTYAMAAMNPKVHFTGLDKNKRQINKAKELYKLPNLDFKIGDASSEIFEEESIDAIINAYVLHEIYSAQRYNERIVSDTLVSHFKALKKGGVMFIRDYARPPPEEFVLLEMPDIPSKGNDLARMSESDLLVWYAEHARPRQDAGCGGFFLEELPERFPRTRLFRLPYKWAYEFIMRKDDRKHWETDLPVEYTYFTMLDFRKQLRALGARMQYSGPYWDDDYISEKFEGKFRLYQDNGQALGFPPTCFVAVAYKMAERKSLQIEERRPSSAASPRIKIMAMRDQNTGEIMDVAVRDITVSEVLPYRIDEYGRLKIYLHDGIARSITNAVPRGGMNIDGRRWSGHMVEPITVDGEALSTLETIDRKSTVLFCRDYLGLKPKGDALIEKGPDYYPAPDYIDERIYTFYLHVDEARGHITPKVTIGAEKFQAKGIIREMDAQQILNAITVGMIPNARLEMQILSLYQHLNIKAETWTDKQLNLQVGKISRLSSLSDLLQRLGKNDTRFREIKGTAGQLRSVNSVFVEEGQSRGSMSGLSSENIDFIIHDGKTINTAIVLPLTKGMKEDVHAGFVVDHLPVPQRHEGNGLTISAPSINIPPDITNQTLLKKFIADQFGVLPNMVHKLGESYFSHVGLTPHKIYPFAVAVPPGTPKNPNIQFLPFYQFMLMRKLTAKQPHFMIAIARAYRYFHGDLKMDAALKVKSILKQRFEGLQPDWSIPLSYESLESLKSKNVIEPDRPAPLTAEKPAIKTITPFHMLDHVENPPVAEAPTATPPDYSGEEVTEFETFEAELEAFLDIVQKETNSAPLPQKW